MKVFTNTQRAVFGFSDWYFGNGTCQPKASGILNNSGAYANRVFWIHLKAGLKRISGDFHETLTIHGPLGCKQYVMIHKRLHQRLEVHEKAEMANHPVPNWN
jgi:nitrogenase molybdenum-iron protein alpha/beta subunit